MPVNLVDNFESVLIPVEDANIIPSPDWEDGDAYRITFTNKKGEHCERINYVSRQGEAIIVNDLKPCHECGTPTNRIDIFYESRFCSDRCIRLFEKDIS